MSAAAVLAFPASGEAVTLGADVHEPSSGYQVCTFSPHCSFVQTKVAGEAVRAPFSGRITRWRLQEPYGTLWIQILKRLPDGQFKALRSSSSQTVTTAGDGEVFAFDANLRIRKGQFVGIGVDDFYSSHLNSTPLEGSDCFKGMVPGLANGESAEPNPGYSGCVNALLYDARLTR